MQFAKFKSVRSLALTTCATAALMGGGVTFAQNGEIYEFEIAAQDLGDALAAFSVQGDVEVYWLTEEVAGKKTKGLNGSFTKEEAVEELLGDAGVDYRIDENGTVLIGEADVRQAGLEQESGPFRVAQVDRQDDRDVEALSDARERDEDEEDDVIVVTGTNIRGIAPESSPTRTFTREDIQISGAATAQDFIQTLPQNFSGGSNANIPTALPNDNSGGANAGGFGSFGSSVNLRGLGSGATLVLLNGRRLAPSSFNGDFTDISMIPASAIERVETLTDGASSIYGSDAIAGVVNFVLRDDFEGLETSLRYGTGTQNGVPNQYRANFTGGRTWGSGHALIVYEFFNQEQLSVEDRQFAAKDFLPNYLLPSQKRHSVLASASHEVTQDFELFADFTFSNREADQLRTLFGSGNTLQNDASSDNLNVSVGGAWNTFSDWYFDFSGAYSRVDTRNETSIGLDRIIVTDSDMWTADAKLSGSLFRLPGGDVKLAFGGHYRAESFLAVEEIADVINREAARDVYALFGEAFIPIIGQDNDVPGVERLEINASGRFEDYSDFGSTSNPKVGLLFSPVEGFSFRGTYSTSFKAPPLGRVGDTGFTASAFNTSFLDPFVSTPSPDPTLDNAVVLTVTGIDKDLDPETSRAFTLGFDLEQQRASHSLMFSATWFDIEFEGQLGITPIPGSLGIFEAVNIAFANPDAFPVGTVVFSPTMQDISALLDSLDNFVAPFGDDPLDAVAINRAGVVRNLSRTKVSGIDFDLSYTYDLGDGSVLLGLDGTYLRDVERQAAMTSPVVETVNTLFNPVDLKVRGRAGYAGNNFTANIFVNYVDSYRVDSTVNSEPIDSWTTVDVSLAYDTTEDFGKSLLNNTVFRLSVVNLFDQDPPAAPTFSNLAVDGFDPTNASPLGRFIAFEITKRW